jgi:hypothetical protein
MGIFSQLSHTFTSLFDKYTLGCVDRIIFDGYFGSWYDVHGLVEHRGNYILWHGWQHILVMDQFFHH